jgi:MOSC domain-containing protein YiiM
MKILSINISLPRKIIFNNKKLLTSIYKEPVNSNVKVNKMGIEGDGQADLNAHGGINKSIYAYSYKHYNHWGNILNKDFINDFGLIGENLTIDNFSEKEYFIGDEFEISNVILKITQPRIPCFKLGIKMNNKEFVKYFTDYSHVGMYMKVLNNGEIKKGDNLKLIYREDNSMTVYEISQLVFKDFNNVSAMKKALKMSYLSEEIKDRFKSRLVKLGHYEII